KNIFFLLIVILSVVSLKAQSDTLVTGSGLKYIILKEGNGIKAEPNKAVEVHYTGRLMDGKVFDSSRERNMPLEFVLGAGQVIKGWDEGIALMNVGDQYKLIIPSGLAYGEKGAGDAIPPNAALIFDVELLSVSDPKISIGDVMLEEIVFKGIDSAVAKYHYLKKNEPDNYNFKESQLNMLGYQLLQSRRPEDAVIVLKLNAETFPQSANVYDSLGEAYYFTGQTELAIENYKKSLEINPDNPGAKEKLKELQKK
ncbi:MAG: FKBP-type peptidyl-prolyl cis-trans isomerase, partial [Ignavibacteriaceae bacterium]